MHYKFTIFCCFVAFCFLPKEDIKSKFRSASFRTDLLYFILNMLTINSIIGFVLSFGLGYVINEHFKNHFYCASPIKDYNVITQFIIVLAVNSLTNYWAHRLLHMNCMWELHKVHHAATEFNGITSFRNHPLNDVIISPIEVLGSLAIGASPIVLLIYGVFNVVYQISVHSDVDWGNGWFGRWILINPSRHRIHHSREERHFNKNFAVLSLYDHLFGTYYEPEFERPAIGFTDDKLHNNENPFTSIFKIYYRFLTNLTK